MVVFINFNQFLIHDLLWRSEELSLIVIELDQQIIQILSFEINAERVPLAMLAVVMVILSFRGIILLRLRHRQAQDTDTNRTLQQSLAPVFLSLCFSSLLNIMAQLTVEVVNFFFQTKSTKAFGTFDAQIHFFFDELSSAATFVVHIWRSKLSEPVHVFLN